MVDGDEGGEDGGEDGLRIPLPGEESWINLSPKTKIVVAAALCFAKAPLPLGQPLFRIYEGVRKSRRRGGARGPRWVGPRGQGISDLISCKNNQKRDFAKNSVRFSSFIQIWENSGANYEAKCLEK